MKTPGSSPPNLVRRIDFTAAGPDRVPALLESQWLVTNGLGGFASGTISGKVTWKYHGLLIAALPAPLGRVLMLNHLAESLVLGDGRIIQFGGDEPNRPKPAALTYLTEFRLENDLPFWRYEIESVVIEKRVLMLNLQNTVHITYTLLSPHDECRIELRPSVHFRPFEGSVAIPFAGNYELRTRGDRFEIDARDGNPPLRLSIDAQESHFTHAGRSMRDMFYQLDAERGYESRGTLWTPGYFSASLRRGAPVTLVASTEEWNTLSALDPESAYTTELTRRQRLLRLADPRTHEDFSAQLVLAADQ